MSEPQPDNGNIEIGMPADDLLKLEGRSRAFFLRKPRKMGEDELGLVVEWYYPDITVELRRRESVYRVVAVRPSKRAQKAQRYRELQAEEAARA